MATSIVYEPQYKLSGWFDDGGPSMDSWFDRDLAGTIIALVRLQPQILMNTNIFFQPQPLTYEVLPAFLVNQNQFFQPVAVRTLGAPDQAIKNEVRRVR
jgi:hypothetical protein